MAEHGHGVPKPNYTQIPNLILDNWLSEMKAAELKVVLAICRKTFGWHKEEDRISLSQLQKLTGLSRQGVINGVNDAIDRGIVLKSGSPKTGYIYKLIVNEIDQPSKHNDLTSHYSGLPLVNEVDQGSQRSRPVLVNEVDTQKKDKETIKERLKKIEEDDALTGDAGASSLNGSTPVNLEGWKDHILKAKNIAGSIGDMIASIYPDQPVEIGRVTGLMRHYGKNNYGFLIANLYGAQLHTVHGDFYDYITKMKNGGNNGSNRKRSKGYKAKSSSELKQHLETTTDPF